MKETACNTSEVVCYSIVFGALDDNMIGGDRGFQITLQKVSKAICRIGIYSQEKNKVMKN